LAGSEAHDAGLAVGKGIALEIGSDISAEAIEVTAGNGSVGYGAGGVGDGEGGRDAQRSVLKSRVEDAGEKVDGIGMRFIGFDDGVEGAGGVGEGDHVGAFDAGDCEFDVASSRRDEDGVFLLASAVVGSDLVENGDGRVDFLAFGDGGRVETRFAAGDAKMDGSFLRERGSARRRRDDATKRGTLRRALRRSGR